MNICVKAGMSYDDAIKQRINSILKDTKKFKHDQLKKEENLKKVEEYRQKLDQLPDSTKDFLVQKIKADIERIDHKFYKEESKEDFYMFFDLDMFFAACEILDRPELASEPLVVGSVVVATSNYEARKYGIRAGMPTFLARKLCPNIIVVGNDYTKYNRYSKLVYGVVRKYDEAFISFGLDEGCLYLNDYINLHLPDETDKIKALEHIIKNFKEEVFEVTGGLTCSVGIAPTKYIAKLCTEVNKPNGHFILRKDKEAVYRFLDQLNIRKLQGIGPNMQDILNGIGIYTVKELRDNLYKVYTIFTEHMYKELLSYCMGNNALKRPGTFKPKNMSIGRSTTFASTKDHDKLKNVLTYLSRAVYSKALKEKKKAKTVTLSVRYDDFTVVTRSNTNKYFINNSNIIYKECVVMLGNVIESPIRLLGIKLSNFQTPSTDLIDMIETSVKEYSQNSKLFGTSSLNFVNNENASNNFSSTVCPLCGDSFNFNGNNAALNRHIDNCMKEGEPEVNTKVTNGYKPRKSKSADFSTSESLASSSSGTLSKPTKSLFFRPRVMKKVLSSTQSN